MKVLASPLVATVFALVFGAASLQAQGITLRAAAGAAVPAGGAADRRDAGPAVMLSVQARLSRAWSLRLDGEWSLLHGPAPPAGQEHFSTYHDLRTVGASLNAVLTLSELDEMAPYLLLGAGAYRLQRIGADRSPYGTTGAVQAGIGIESNFWRRINPFVEARALAHITDYGSDELSPTVYWPLLIGIRAHP